MTASLVTLFQSRNGWTNEERAQFARIERLLDDAGFAVDVEHGLSDEGEPWCVFCSRITGDVIIHVASIDGRFMFDSSTLPRPIEGASFQRCAERFFEDVSLPMPLAERKGRVYLHPSAMLASLFITVLLYAQATTEVPLFDTEAVDVDDPDAPVTPTNPLALKLKAIAAQVAEFANADTQQANQQTYVNPAMAAIPAGMALAVIAIAQDLANAEESGLLLDEEVLLALATEARAQTDLAAPEAGIAEVEPAAEDAETQGRLHGDAAALGEAAAEEAEPITGEMVSAAVEAEVDAILAGLVAVAEDIGEAVDGLASLAALDSLGFALEGDAPAQADAQADGPSLALAAVSGAETALELFQSVFDPSGVIGADSFAFELEGRVLDIDIVVIAEAAFEEFEMALAQRVLAAGAAEFAVGDLGSDGYGSDVAAGGWQSEGGELARPVETASADPSLSSPAPLYPRRAPDAATDRIVSLGEAKALVVDFMEAVGDTGIFASDGASLDTAEGLDGLLDGLLASGNDTTFFDSSLYNRGSIDFGSRNLHAEYVYLEDNTKLTFYGHQADFDGFI